MVDKSEVCIISMPNASDAQIQKLGAVLSSVESMPHMPIYITKATIRPVNKDEVMELYNYLSDLVEHMGWTNTAPEKVYNASPI